jgi:vitamin B12 transporter
MYSPGIRRLLALAASIATLLHHSAQAQQDGNSPLDEIVVTSSRVPIPLRQIGTSVSVLTTADIEAHGNLALTDVLRQMPAIASSSNGGAGKSTSVRIRGEEGFRTLTIFDGLRLSDPSSTQVGPQLEHLLSSGIGRVEVLRGPQGLSYGADAGGIVNISSRQGEPGLQFNLDAQGGKFGTQQYSANAGGGNARADFFLSAAAFTTRGFSTRDTDTVLRDDDGYENTTFHGRAGIDVTSRLRLDLVHRDVDGASDFDGCFDPVTFATVHDCTGSFDLQASRAALDYDSGNFTHSLAYATTKTARDNLTAGVSTFGANGELNRWEYVGSATALPGFDVVFGADLEEALNNGSGRNNTGVYLEYLSDFSDRVYVTAGARHDDNDDFGTNTSYRASGAYLVDMADATLKFKGSYGTGFRAPSPYEIAYNSGPDSYPPAALVSLRQERSKGFETGVEYLQGNSWRVEAVYFDQDVQDAIFFDLDAFSGYLQDLGLSTSKGVELSGELSVGEHWHLTANYTYNDTERPNGLPRRRRPEDLVNLGVSWFGSGDRLNFNGYYRIAKNAIDESGSRVIRLQDFAVLDLSANYSISANIQVYGRIENALDEDYQEITGYNTAGRAAYVGIRMNYAGL